MLTQKVVISVDCISMLNGVVGEGGAGTYNIASTYIQGQHAGYTPRLICNLKCTFPFFTGAAVLVQLVIRASQSLFCDC